MKRYVILLAILTAILPFLSSCNREDVGPLQEGQQTFALMDFNRLEMGSGFDVDVQPGAVFSVVAKGDTRNLDDLEVVVKNGTLSAKYRTQRSRKFTTNFTIIMPTLRGANFSGGVHSTVKGFANLSNLDIELSGGTHATWEVIAAHTFAVVSGGSKLQLIESKVTTNNGDELASSIYQLSVDASGGSHVEAFDYAADDVNVKASGGSHAEITVNKTLTADASGASHINYKGNPTSINQNSSGASKVERK
jgi:hypothetical protein